MSSGGSPGAMSAQLCAEGALKKAVAAKDRQHAMLKSASDDRLPETRKCSLFASSRMRNADPKSSVRLIRGSAIWLCKRRKDS